MSIELLYKCAREKYILEEIIRKLLTNPDFYIIIYSAFVWSSLIYGEDVNLQQGGADHEKNLPAQEETEKKGTRFQKKNGYR